MQKIMAVAEEARMKTKTFGGDYKEIETDVFSLGQTSKNGLGFQTLNKAYVQYLTERGGPVLLETFPNPTGGSERLSQIEKVLNENIAEESILLSDGARAVKAWVSDHPDLSLVHCVVKHAEVIYILVSKLNGCLE